MNYYKEIKEKIKDNEIYERVKDYSKERHRVLTYFEIGRLLYEAGKHYGESIIQKYALALEKDFGRKYDQRTLRRMRQFYLLFSELKWTTPSQKQKVATPGSQAVKEVYFNDIFNQKVATLPHQSQIVTTPHSKQKWATPESMPSNTLYNKENSEQKWATPEKNTLPLSILTLDLTWSHYKEILSIYDLNEAFYYTKLATNNRLSVRELRARIKSKEYYRLDEKTRNKLIRFEDVGVIDYVKNPIIINNRNNYEVESEKILKLLILEDIKNFLKELGEGFCFIEDEYKIKIDDRYNYIDLLLYNIKYKCYVVIELKITEFKTEYIGQILKYMHYVDRHVKSIYEDNTIGIIICKKNNDYYMGYCSDERVIAREYKLT